MACPCKYVEHRDVAVVPSGRQNLKRIDDGRTDMLGSLTGTARAMSETAIVVGELVAVEVTLSFYDLARGAFAVILTGEPRAYGNVMLRKGVVL